MAGEELSAAGGRLDESTRHSCPFRPNLPCHHCRATGPERRTLSRGWRPALLESLVTSLPMTTLGSAVVTASAQQVTFERRLLPMEGYGRKVWIFHTEHSLDFLRKKSQYSVDLATPGGSLLCCLEPWPLWRGRTSTWTPRLLSEASSRHPRAHEFENSISSSQTEPCKLPALWLCPQGVHSRIYQNVPELPENCGTPVPSY